MSKAMTFLMLASVTVAGVAAGVAEFHLMTRILYETPAALSWGLVVASPFLLLFATTWFFRKQLAAAMLNLVGVLLVSGYGCAALYRGEPWPVPGPTLYYAVFVAIQQLLWVGLLVCFILIMITIGIVFADRKPNENGADKPRLLRRIMITGYLLFAVLGSVLINDTPADIRAIWDLCVAGPLLLLVAITWFIRRHRAAGMITFAGMLMVSAHACVALLSGSELHPLTEPTDAIPHILCPEGPSFIYAVFEIVQQFTWFGLSVLPVLILIIIGIVLADWKPRGNGAGLPRLVRPFMITGCLLVVVLAYLGAARVAWWQGNPREEPASYALLQRTNEFEMDIVFARNSKRIAEARAKPTAEAVSELRRWMREGDSNTHYMAFSALQSYGEDAAPAVPELVEEFMKPGAAGAAGSDLAARFLEDLGPAAKDAVPRLVECLKDDAPEMSWRRRWAAEILGSIGPDASAAIPALAETMNSDPNSVVRDKAMRALAKIDPQGQATGGRRDEANNDEGP